MDRTKVIRGFLQSVVGGDLTMARAWKALSLMGATDREMLVALMTFPRGVRATLKRLVVTTRRRAFAVVAPPASASAPTFLSCQPQNSTNNAKAVTARRLSARALGFGESVPADFSPYR